jgi:hypothetical protein
MRLFMEKGHILPDYVVGRSGLGLPVLPRVLLTIFPPECFNHLHRVELLD